MTVFITVCEFDHACVTFYGYITATGTVSVTICVYVVV